MSGSPPSSSLFATQTALRAALHDGDAEAIGPLLGPGDPARLEIYRSMYWARQAESLAEDFPQVRRFLGEALFDRVAVTHVKRHPSRHPSLAFLGRDFDETLLHLGQDAEAAVARLEWARVEAFWSPAAEPATPEFLGAFGDRLGETVLVFHPSLRLVTSPVDGARVVWRRGNRVEEAALDPRQERALRLALEGANVAVVCEVFVDTDAPEEAAIQCLVRWVLAGWVVDARLDEPTGDGASP